MQKNSGYFDESKSRNYLIINIISGTNVFPNMEFVQEKSK